MRIAKVIKAKNLREGDQVLCDGTQWHRVVEVDHGYTDQPRTLWVRFEGVDDPEQIARSARVLVLR